MTLTMQNSGAALVGSAAVPTRVAAVRVLRPFMFNCQAQAVDTEIELPGAFAFEMVSAKKAELLPAPAPAAGPAPAAAPSPATKPRKAKD